MSRLFTRPPGHPRLAAPGTRGRGFTLIEMLTVLVILSFLIVFFSKKFVQMGSKARAQATQKLIDRIGIALARYQAECRSLPPDTGYGQALSDPVAQNNVVVYDSCSLWRYLAEPVTKCRSAQDPTPIGTVGPFLSFKYDPKGYTELQTFDGGRSYYVVDAWGRPIGYIGSPKRVIHNRGFADLYSAGPDGITYGDPACTFTGPDDPSHAPNQAYENDGDVSAMGGAVLNGCLTSTRANPRTEDGEVDDDINNWDPQKN